MAWTPETTRPTVISPDLIGRQYDAAIDGEPLIVDWTGSGQVEGLGHPEAAGYAQNSAEIGIPQQSTSDDISENKLSINEFWRSMRDWQGGFSQHRFDVPKVSRDNAYHEATDIDPRTPGQLSLRRTAAQVSVANFTTARMASEAATNGIWVIHRSDGVTAGVTHYDLTTQTVKTTATAGLFYDITVDPNDNAYIAASNNIYTVTSGGAISVWCAQSSGVIQAAKRRLFIVGLKAAGPPEVRAIYEVPTEGAAPVAATEKTELPPGTYCADIKEAGALVLFAVNPKDYRGSPPATTFTGQSPRGQGVVYAYDGTNAPYRALVMPVGENIYAIHSALGGSLVLLFVVRQDAAGNVRTVIYKTGVSGTSLLPLELAFEYLSSYNVNIACNETVSLGRHIYFVAPGDGTTSTARIDSYNISEGTVAHDVATTGTVLGYPRSLTTYQGRLLWAHVTATGPQTGALLVESASTYVASGTITTSAIDLNVDAPKLWTTVEASCLPLTVGQKIEIRWSADQPGTEDFHLLGTLQPGQSHAAFPLGIQSVRLRLRATLYSGASATTTPTLTKLGVGAQMARLPKLDHAIKIQVYPNQEDLAGVAMPAAGADYLQHVSQRLEALRVSGQPAWFQSPLSRFDGHAHRVKVGEVARRVTGNPAQGVGGTIAVALHNTDPDRRNLLPLAWASYASMPVAIATVGDIYEAVSSATLAYTLSTSWVAGAGKQLVQVTVAADGRGVRFPSPRLTVPIDPVKYKGLLFSTGCLVCPSVDAMILQLTLEWYDASDVLISSTSAPATTFGTGSANTWLPLKPVEGQSFDAYTALLYPVLKILRVTGSASGAFLVDGAQLEQASVSTRFQLPPATY